MATFNSDKAKQKWDQIQKAESIPLQRIAAGNGTPQDYKRVGTTLGQYSKLASSVFGEAVRSIDEQARKRIDAINASRERTNKAALTEVQVAALTARAVEDGWRQHYDTLVRDVAELIEVSSTEQTETLGGYLDDHFSQLKNEQQERDTSAADGTRKDFYEALDVERDLENETWLERAATLAAAVKTAVQESFKELIESRRQDNEEVDYSVERIADDKKQSLPEVSVTLQADTEEAMKTAVVQQTSFNASVEDMLRDIPTGEEASEAKSEEADSWWRRFKTYVGDKWEKGKDSIWTELLKLGAALYVTNPELRKWVSDKIDAAKEIFTMENLEKVVKSMIKYLSDQASSLANWIMKKLGMDDESKLEDRIEDRNKAIDYWNSQAAMFDEMAKKTSNDNTKKRYEQKAEEARSNSAAAAKERDDKKTELDKIKKDDKEETEVVSAGGGGGGGGGGSAAATAPATGGSAPVSAAPASTEVTTQPAGSLSSVNELTGEGTATDPSATKNTSDMTGESTATDPSAVANSDVLMTGETAGGAATGMPTRGQRRAARMGTTSSTIDTPSMGPSITGEDKVNSKSAGSMTGEDQVTGATMYDMESFGYNPSSGDELMLANLLS